MRTVLALVVAACLTFAAVRLAPAADAPPAPPAAAPAMKKYQAAVAAADAERARTVDKARAQLVTDLKAAQKAALQNNDVDGATALAALAKQHAAAGPAAGSYAGTAWVVKGETTRLNADGTCTLPDPKFRATWATAGDRTVVIFFAHGYVDVWRFDADGKSFKAVGYQEHNHLYDGVPAR